MPGGADGDGPSRPHVFCREAERAAYRIGGSGGQGLSHRGRALRHGDLDPHSEHETAGHSERSREYLYVVEGALRMQVGEAAFDLGPGDAICFDASQRHVYRNPGDAVCHMICVNHYPA